MVDYTKVGVLVMRCFGLLIVLYATPVLILGAIRMASGVTLATDGRTPIRAAFLGWFLYGLAGVLLFLLAKPLGRFAARGLDQQSSAPPAS